MMSGGENYTREELFQLWRGFRGQENTIKMLRDFGCLEHWQAVRLHAEFEQEYTKQFKEQIARPYPVTAVRDPSQWDWDDET